jgi:citrate synthase
MLDWERSDESDRPDRFDAHVLLELSAADQVRAPRAPMIAPPGLEGVVVADTQIGDVRGEEGFYHYRQYDAIELANKRSLEDVWHLLYEGTLPDRQEGERFAARTRALRSLPPPLIPALQAIVRTGKQVTPLDALRTACSLLAAAEGFTSWLDIDRSKLRDQALRICAALPTLVAALHRMAQGSDPIEPRPDLAYAANYLYMLTGGQPQPDRARALEQYLISTVDHGFNASTFTARVIASTGADIGAAVVGALAALSGPLHGGAPSRSLGMLDAIGTVDQAEAWIRKAVSSGQRLMGFGHRVYRTEDPRARLLRGVAERVGGPRLELAKAVEARALAVLHELKPGHKLFTNVEFYAGVVLEEIGLDRDLFTPSFVCSRSIGWTAHYLEQVASNRLIRPSARYTGPEPPQPVPNPA